MKIWQIIKSILFFAFEPFGRFSNAMGAGGAILGTLYLLAIFAIIMKAKMKPWVATAFFFLMIVLARFILVAIY